MEGAGGGGGGGVPEDEYLNESGGKQGSVGVGLSQIYQFHLAS